MEFTFNVLEHLVKQLLLNKGSYRSGREYTNICLYGHRNTYLC